MSAEIKNWLKRILPMPARTQYALLEDISKAYSLQIGQLMDAIAHHEKQYIESLAHQEMQYIEALSQQEMQYNEALSQQEMHIVNVLSQQDQQQIEKLEKLTQRIQKVEDELASNKELLLNLTRVQSQMFFSLVPDANAYMPKVSVIVPVYNAEPYLHKCLDTILAQTLLSYEIICVNDGSTDKSAEILETYAKRDPKIKVVQQDNQGAGVARNTGIKRAAGEYLMFLDADDFFEPLLLQRLYEACTSFNADICLCSGDHYDNTTRQYESAPWLLNTHLLPSQNPFSWEDCQDQFFQITAPNTWTKLFRRSFIEDSGLRFQSTKRTNDLYFVYSALALAERVTVCNMPLIHYRTNVPGSLQSNLSETPHDLYKALAELQTKLKEKGIYSKLEQSFAAMALNNFMYYIEMQTSAEVADALFSEFVKNYLHQFDIHGKPRDQFDQYRYDQYEERMAKYE